MTNTNKYTRPSQARLYDLSYHLLNTDNLRLRGQADKLIKIIPARYNCEVVFTKRRIWFIKDKVKLIQIIIQRQKIFLKIRTSRGWQETRLKDWENFTRIFRIIENL